MLMGVVAVIAIWIGAGMIVKSIEKVARGTHISTFVMSFFLLGILTSTPEIAVGWNALNMGRPEIYIGNLVGGTIVLFLLVVPILAIVSGKIRLNHGMDSRGLGWSLVVMLLPVMMAIDRKIWLWEGIVATGCYLALFLVVGTKKKIDSKEKKKQLEWRFAWMDVVKLLVGVGMVVVSSREIVERVIWLAQQWNVSQLWVSMLVLSVGTNLPELSLAIRVAMTGRNGVAIGDYLGSAAANTLLFGVMTLANGVEVQFGETMTKTAVFMAVGLLMFWKFVRSKGELNRGEAVALLVVYGIYLWVEKM